MATKEELAEAERITAEALADSRGRLRGFLESVVSRLVRLQGKGDVADTLLDIAIDENLATFGRLATVAHLRAHAARIESGGR